jgi:hypothetical protein
MLNFVGTEALILDIIHFDFIIALTVDIIVFLEKMGCIQMCKIRQNYVILRREIRIEALKGKIFNFNENNENHRVYPGACERAL